MKRKILMDGANRSAKFGSATVRMDGSKDFVARSDWATPSDFVIEAWVRLS